MIFVVCSYRIEYRDIELGSAKLYFREKNQFYANYVRKQRASRQATVNLDVPAEVSRSRSKMDERTMADPHKVYAMLLKYCPRG